MPWSQPRTAEELLDRMRGGETRFWRRLGEERYVGALLAGADLSGRDLSGIDLGVADLRGTNLTGATMCSVGLRYANLEGACLEGADLTGADLTGANLEDARLSDVRLQGAMLLDASAATSSIVHARLDGASIDWSTVVRSGWSTEMVRALVVAGARALELETWDLELARAAAAVTESLIVVFPSVPSEVERSVMELEVEAFVAAHGTMARIGAWAPDSSWLRLEGASSRTLGALAARCSAVIGRQSESG